jgi:hypothetical protein
MSRCTALTKDGKPCKALAARGTDKCVWHGDADIVGRGPLPLTTEKMIHILEIQLRRVRKIKDVGEQARETRALINQITALKNNTSPESNDNGGLIEDRVHKWKTKNQTS